MITTNTGAKKIEGTDNWRGIFDAHNDSVDAHDQAIAKNEEAITTVQAGLAYIVGNTNTTGSKLSKGQFVYVKGHSTIAEGLRKVTASISANGDITTNNTSACSEGGLNALNDKIKPSGGTHAGFFVYNGRYHSGLFIPYPRADVITASCSTFDLVGITTGVSVDSIEKFKNGFLLQHTFADTTTPNSYNGKSGQATLSFS